MNPTGNKRHDDTELVKISHHLSYEIVRFLDLGIVQVGGSDNALIKAISDAVLESFVVHFRILCAFFYPQDPKKGDVLAGHFFNRPSDWRPPKLSKYLRDSKTRAHKEVAHLSYDRLKVTPDEKFWKPQKIRNEMMPVIREFLRTVPESRFGPECSALKAQLVAAAGDKEV